VPLDPAGTDDLFFLDVCAADLQEEMAEHAFPFRQLRRRRRQPSEHRRERMPAVERSLIARPAI
jgi:hypothetical protein